MEYTTEQIQEMAKLEANDRKHEHIKLDYQDGIYYGYQVGFKKALSLFAISGQSEQFNCGKERVFGEDRCDKQCNDCLKEYGSN